MKILFICRGNVGRSQMAAALFSKMLPEHDVSSAGTRVVDKKGNSRDGQKLGDLAGAHHVIECLLEEGMDVRENTRRQLTPAIVQGANKIIVMAEPATIPNYLKDSPKAIYWDVTDPKGTDLEAHRGTRDLIKGLLAGL